MIIIDTKHVTNSLNDRRCIICKSIFTSFITRTLELLCTPSSTDGRPKRAFRRRDESRRALTLNGVCRGELGNFERGRRYIYNRKDEIIHGLCPSVKCVAPVFSQSLKCRRGRPSPSCAPGRLLKSGDRQLNLLVLSIVHDLVYLLRMSKFFNVSNQFTLSNGLIQLSQSPRRRRAARPAQEGSHYRHNSFLIICNQHILQCSLGDEVKHQSSWNRE